MGARVLGVEVDTRTGCAHHRSDRDIIAIRLPCCGELYACHACHEETADHRAAVWPAAQLDRPIVLCGACGSEMSARDYLGAEDRCPHCAAAFNPGCRLHHHLYFDLGAPPGPGPGG